tara:strand:+ start:367 stop:603 length:237 start_codon:yes stop_codon:yes gene_type:complete
MKTKLTLKSNIQDQYTIIFGNEKFIAKYNKTYPRLAEWSLSRRQNSLSNTFMEGYFYCGNNFKSLNEIKKFIRDRKYL